jgi:hypothetical protein
VGRARQFDEHGTCTAQTLVTTADRRRLLAKYETLFPGAKPPELAEPIAATTTRSRRRSGGTVLVQAPAAQPKQSYAAKLLAILGRPGLPKVLSTSWISEELGKPWRQVGRQIMALADVRQALTTLGWRYVLRKGRQGSYFEKLGATRERELSLPPPALLKAELSALRWPLGRDRSCVEVPSSPFRT